MQRTIEEIGNCVVKRPGESDENLLKRFKKKVHKSGVLKELKMRSYYLKPSEFKKRKRNENKKINERDAFKLAKEKAKLAKKSKEKNLKNDD